MGLFSTRSLALKWSFFFISGTIVFMEYFNLYMKQFGFSPSQIGLTTLFGVFQLLVPLFGFLGDRFRARKLILTVLVTALFLITLAPLLPLVVPLPTCFVKQGESSINQGAVNMYRNVSFNRLTYLLLQEEVKWNTNVPWFSTLFLFMIMTRASFTFFECAVISLVNLATITYLKEKRARYGSYFMWCHIGGTVSLFAVGLLAAHFTLIICGVIRHGYYIAFVWSSASMILSSLALPWFKYEYLEHRVMNWKEVKSVFSDVHYLFVLIVGLFLGSCAAFQLYWEFWYISELSGSPTIMGMAGLIRRPLVAVCFYLSGHLIERVGDLKTTAVALFLFSVSFFAISFINIPWLVLVIDILQAAAFALSYTGLNIHFSKPGSKASSAIILGKKSAFIIINTFIRYLIAELHHVFSFCVLNLVWSQNYIYK